MDTLSSPALDDQVSVSNLGEAASEGESARLFSFPDVPTMNWEQGDGNLFWDEYVEILQGFIAVINDGSQQTSVIEYTDADSCDNQIYGGIDLPMQEDFQPSLIVTSPPRDYIIPTPAGGWEIDSQDRCRELNHVMAAPDDNGRALHIGEGHNLHVPSGSKAKRRGTMKKLSCASKTFPVKTDDIRLADGYTWRKYGNKRIKNMTFRRAYFRCAEHDKTDCPVRKYVQRRAVAGGPRVDYTYIGRHNHPARKQPGANTS